MSSKWIYYEFTRNSSGIHSKFIGNSSEIHKDFLGIHRKFVGNSSKVLRKFIESSSEIHRKFFGSSSKVLRKYVKSSSEIHQKFLRKTEPDRPEDNWKLTKNLKILSSQKNENSGTKIRSKEAKSELEKNRWKSAKRAQYQSVEDTDEFR